VIVGLAACAPPPAATRSSEIAATTEAWVAAFNAGDIEALVALYAEDAQLLPPNDEMKRGSEAVREDFQAMISAGLKIRLETVEALAAGDLGQKVGLYTLEGPGGTTIDRGKYIELWRKVDGQWRISHDTWNSDLPPAPPGALVTVTHEVRDAGHWLAAWSGPESRRAMFAEHGAPEVSVIQSAGNPNLTGLVLRVTDMEAFQAMLDSPEGQASKAEDGVKDATMRVFIEVR
jgi:uncharacterized protein (TIGR02246 family)